MRIFPAVIYHPVTADSLVLAWDYPFMTSQENSCGAVRVDGSRGTTFDEVNW
ncbi:MAG: hypothetical protein R2769_02490 [Saprospiraceae bacterium]